MEVCDLRRLPESPQRLCSKAEIEAFLEAQFLNPVYKEALNRRGLVRDWVDKLAQAPVWFYDMVDPDLEYYGFTTFWRHITLRRCYGPYRTDQYVLHEIVHTASYDYEGEDPLAQKFYDNERIAGEVSNVEVYFEFPDLRTLNPRRGMWVDQLLDDTVALVPGVKNRDLYVADRPRFEARLDDLRQRATDPRHPQSHRVIAMDRLVSESLAPIYAPIAEEVSARVLQLMRSALVDPVGAAMDHERWLKTKQGETDVCPFQSVVGALRTSLPELRSQIDGRFNVT